VAFEVLYDRHHRGILAFCRHMLRSADEAEDAVQHTFISAYNDLLRTGGRELRFKAWLYTIARNRCVSILRARREQVSDEIDVSTDRLSDDVQQRADLQVLLADIAGLPDDQREALVLSEVGDLSHAEVAAVIGCEVPKVKSLVFQARSALIERRQGRDTPCEDIREQLATLKGGALRRSQLRHHLAACPGCRDYRDQVRRQREMLALALPVVPSLALRHNVLAAVGLGGGGAAGGAGIGGGISVAAKSGLAKVGIAAVVAAGGAGTAVVATTGHVPILGHSATTSTGPGTAHDASAGGASTTGTSGAAAHHSVTATSLSAHHHGRSAQGTAHGFTPVQGGSNGAAAKQFAATRGNGKHLGITKTHHHARTHVSPTHRHTHIRTHVTPTHPQPAPRPAPRTQSTPAQPPTRTTTETTTSTTTTTTTAPAESTPTSTPTGGHGKGGSVLP
jgi:RNA polymerase sigma factor (sigma-70 family)